MTESYLFDEARLKALRRSALIDSRQEEAFDRFTRLASHFLNADVALISLVGSDRQFFKSQIGLPEPWASLRGTPLDHSVCTRVVETRQELVLEDLSRDPAWCEHPAVKNINVVSYLGVPIHSPEGHVLGSFCIINTTPRQWTETDIAAMRDLVGLLESKIRLRAEIEKRNEIATRLNETNLRIGEYSEKITSAINAIAHEIRTVITSIQGHVEIAQTADEPGQRDHSIDVISKNTGHMLKLVNETLEASRLESFETQYESIEFHLVGFSQEILETIAPVAAKKSLELQFDQPGGKIPVYVKGDPTRIKQILLNLLANAIKFTETGHVRLLVEMEEWLEAHPVTGIAFGTVRWDVSDTGPGMDETQINNLFQPFHQSDATVYRRFGGSGLGLYISRKLALGMNGTLDVQSSTGGGSLFTLRIPIEIPPFFEMTRISQEIELAIAGFLKSPKILVAEDSPDIQNVTHFILKRLGCKPIFADNGLIALETALANQEEIDMILMDADMPVMNGAEATRKLRKRGFTKPIIALSASVDQVTVGNMIRAGCDEALAKPIETTAFLRVLKTHASPA